MTIGLFNGYNFNVNYAPTTGADSMFSLMSLLVSSSWIVNQSSDGTIFSTNSNVITGSGQLQRSGSWFVIQQSISPNRSFCFQHNASTTEHSRWRVSYSPANGFLVGNPGLTQIPSASDQFNILGAGTNLAPTFAQLFPNDATYKFHSLAATTAKSNKFFIVTNSTGSTIVNSIFAFDVFQLGTYVSLDTDPSIILQRTSASLCLGRETLCAKNNAWGKFGSSIYPFSAWEMGQITQVTGSGKNYVGFPCGNDTTNIYTGKDDLMPIPWGRVPAYYTSPFGYKGMSGMFFWPSVLRTSFTPISIVNSNDYIIIDNVIIPWAGILPSL